MNIQGKYTNKGLALTAKTAAGACLRVTRVVGGSGHTTDVPNAAQLSEIRQTLTVGEAHCTGDTAVLPVTLAAMALEDSYTLTELGIYAEDPDEGEILYCVYRLDEPTTIQAGSDTVLRFYLRQTVSKDGGAEVLCSPVGLITESDCAPVRKMVLAVGAPQRYVTVPASELQTYLDALPRLLTEHHVITLRGTNSNIVSVKDFYGCGSLTLRADKVGDCVFTKDVIVGNCSIPVIMEGQIYVPLTAMPRRGEVWSLGATHLLCWRDAHFIIWRSQLRPAGAVALEFMEKIRKRNAVAIRLESTFVKVDLCCWGISSRIYWVAHTTKETE